jgi:Holliday junction resolvasome RuvABC endonuclease subunit
MLIGLIEEKMRVLSFDQASAKSGFALYDDGKLVDHGAITVKEKDAALRLNIMFTEIANKIEEYTPDLVIIEGTALQSNAYSLIMLAQLQGMIVGYCYKKNVKYKIVGVTTWRKALGFRQGPKVAKKELKAQAKELALKLVNEDKKVTEDEADAICIGYACVSNKSILGGN